MIDTTEALLRQEIGFVPDGRWNEWWVEVLASHNLRDLRGHLMAMAYVLEVTQESGAKALCVVSDSKITMERLHKEFHLATRVLRPELASKLHVGLVDSVGTLRGIPDLGPLFTEWLEKLIKTESGRSIGSGSTQQSVLAYLLINWLQCRGPQSTTAIQVATGASYPTVANVLKRLESLDIVDRSSDRSIELKRFPWDEWRRWVLVSKTARKTQYFVNRSGQVRSPENMASRLNALQRSDVGIGGVLGAKHYFPKLDITGSIRLDVTVTGSAKSADLDFIQQIDAGLVPTSDANEQATVAVHFLGNRVNSFFEHDGQTFWADPFECLADLHELRLDMQADEMLKALIAIRQTTQLQQRKLSTP